MTKEEQLAFMATVSQQSNRFEELLSYINKSEVLREELRKLAAAQDKPKTPQYVTPKPTAAALLLSPFGSGDTLKKCSHCGYGYLVRQQFPMFHDIFSSSGVLTCPKCGNVESWH